MLTARIPRLYFLAFLIAWREYAVVVVGTSAELGAVCDNDDDCATKRCHQGFSPTKICACNSNTNSGCPAGQICWDAPTAYDGLPECRTPGSLAVGNQCQVDSDCESLRCFYGEQLPGTPGTCACNSKSNVGCLEGRVCSDEPTFVDGLPECIAPGVGQIGDDCLNDSDCDSRRCFPNRMVGLPGSCRCNSYTNAGCFQNQTCSDDPMAYDALPECVGKPGDFWNSIVQMFLSMWQVLVTFLRSLVS